MDSLVAQRRWGTALRGRTGRPGPIEKRREIRPEKGLGSVARARYCFLQQRRAHTIQPVSEGGQCDEPQPRTLRRSTSRPGAGYRRLRWWQPLPRLWDARPARLPEWPVRWARPTLQAARDPPDA